MSAYIVTHGSFFAPSWARVLFDGESFCSLSPRDVLCIFYPWSSSFLDGGLGMRVEPEDLCSGDFSSLLATELSFLRAILPGPECLAPASTVFLNFFRLYV